MRIVIGVDWSDEAFAAVQQAVLLYRPTEVTVVHGIEMGMFEYPAVAHLAGAVPAGVRVAEAERPLEVVAPALDPAAVDDDADMVLTGGDGVAVTPVPRLTGGRASPISPGASPTWVNPSVPWPSWAPPL